MVSLGLHTSDLDSSSSHQTMNEWMNQFVIFTTSFNLQPLVGGERRRRCMYFVWPVDLLKTLQMSQILNITNPTIGKGPYIGLFNNEVI